MEERLQALESEHVTTRKELAELDRKITRILAKLDAHFSEGKKYDQTIRNIDENLDSLIIDFAKQPMVRNKEVQALIGPLWKSVRAQEAALAAFKILAEKEHHRIKHEVKNEFRKEVKIIIGISGALIGIILSVSAYVFIQGNDGMKTDISGINSRISANREHLDRHHENHFYLDNARRESEGVP